MSDFSSWMQANWNGLGTFVVEISFLFAAVWFARNVLRMLRAFQEQVGALLKLTITPSAEHESSAAHPKHPSLASSPYWLTPSETQPAALSQPAEPGPSRFALVRHGLANSWHGFVVWLNQPMRSAQVGPWRRFVTWLQTPARS